MTSPMSWPMWSTATTQGVCPHTAGSRIVENTKSTPKPDCHSSQLGKQDAINVTRAHFAVDFWIIQTVPQYKTFKAAFWDFCHFNHTQIKWINGNVVLQVNESWRSKSQTRLRYNEHCEIRSSPEIYTSQGNWDIFLQSNHKCFAHLQQAEGTHFYCNSWCWGTRLIHNTFNKCRIKNPNESWGKEYIDFASAQALHANTRATLTTSFLFSILLRTGKCVGAEVFFTNHKWRWEGVWLSWVEFPSKLSIKGGGVEGESMWVNISSTKSSWQ